MFSLPRAIYILTLATTLLISGTPMAVLVGGIVGAQYAPSPSLATLPLAAMVLGMAGFAYIASHILNNYSYKRLFIIGFITSCCASLTAIAALYSKSFTLWLIAMTLVGVTGACSQQMRFACTLFVQGDKQKIPLALSVFMLGGVIAALLGPELALLNTFSALPHYASGFIILMLCQCVGLFLVLWLPVQEYQPAAAQEASANNNTGLLAIVASVTAYGIMSFVMTATPVSMHEHQGHDLVATKSVIQWHILAMFIPSFFSGVLISRLGTSKAMLLGLSLYAGVFAFTLQGYEFIHYASGLILLGLGWNILFTAGSTLAAQQPSKTFKGRHDSWVFGIQAIASLSAGFALHYLGWFGIQWLALIACLPLLVMIVKIATASK